MIDNENFYEDLDKIDCIAGPENKRHVKESMILASYEVVEVINKFLEDRRFFQVNGDFTISRKFEDGLITIKLEYKK